MDEAIDLALEEISTHSPHPGRDMTKRFGGMMASMISTHSPHPGRDPCIYSIARAPSKYFNPLSPSGERRG